MKTVAQAAAPRIETLLAAAHRNYNALREQRGTLVRSGIDGDHLPDDPVLMAFALLDDHERDALRVQVREYWAALQSKGLVYGAIDDVTTAELRLLVLVREHTEAIGSLWQQLQEAVDAPEPPPGIWRGPTHVRGLWGQEARLHFSVQYVQHLLIHPDPVFGLQPALRAVDPDVCHTGAFSFPIDNGAITITLRHRNGEVYRHLVQVMVEEMV
jgi:hypothetical protein